MTKKISLKEALELIKFELLAQASGKIRQVPTLAGRPGIGKTDALKDLAEKLGYKLITVQLSAVAPEELSGIPDFRNAPEEFARTYSVLGADSAKYTQWSVPELAAVANEVASKVKEEGGKGVVILLDDIHAADPALERYMFNMFLDKTVGQYRLAKNVLICAAMNDSAEAGFTGFNAAVLDRLAIYPVEFDFNHWYRLIGGQLDPLVASFLKSHQERCQGDESVDKVTPSPRSWTELSNFIKFMKGEGVKITNALLRNAALARVGEEAAAELVKFKVVYDRFDFENLIKQPVNKIKLPTDMVEQIIFAGIVRYMKTRDDGQKIIDLVTSNRDKSLFITEVINEVSALFRTETFKDNEGIKTFVDWIIETDDEQIVQIFYDPISSISI